MTVTLISEPDYSLLPVICTCISCHAKSNVTEFSDFTYVSNSESDNPDYVHVPCAACGNTATPASNKMAAICSSHKLWQKTNPQNHQEPWSTEFTCPECKTTTKINTKQLRLAVDTGHLFGDNYGDKVVIHCPACESSVDAKKLVPSGIYQKVLFKTR